MSVHLVTSSAFADMLIRPVPEHTRMAHSGAATDQRSESVELDPIEAFSCLGTTSRANLVSDIVGHPKGMPSKIELDHMNPSLAPSTISGHLRTLEEKGIIRSARIDRNGHARDAPEAFFYLTDAARELFDRNNVFDEDTYRAAYQEVSKPSTIQEAESADRPTVDASTVTH